jgi:DNA primase
MALSPAFLDEIRARTSLSGLIGASITVTKMGREWKACCPFHNEKSPSFTINDDKGFYHCFGCGAHGDVFSWLTQQAGLPFIDAVKELADKAGMVMPAPSAEAQARERSADTVREALTIAQGIYAHQLTQAGTVVEYLARREIGMIEIATFELGYARGRDGSLRGRGISQALGLQAGLLTRRDDGQVRELFYDRITVPIHDHRGRLIGFGARVWPGRASDTPKFVNSPDGPLFDKGRTLFNLHRAAPASRPQAENRLVVVEGYFDVVAMTRAGFAACVAPMGTALTEHQLERCWRLHHRPIVLFDGDAAGQRAALRACRTALPHLGPGRELAVALLPDGHDPDDLLRMDAGGMGRREIAGRINEARACHAFVFDVLAAELGEDPAPEAIAGLWSALADLAGGIADDETRAQYLGLWRARFEREVSGVPATHAAMPMHAITRADDGEYAFPDSEGDSAARLIALIRVLLKRREERRAINEEIADVMKMAELAGFQKKAITAAVQDIESDIKHGPGKREEDEMHRALYRRTLGIHGPMNEAMLPQLVDGRPRGASAQIKRRAAMHALIDARAVEV